MAPDWATVLDEPIGLDLRQDGRSRRLALSLAAVLAALYLPFLWEPFVPIPETSGVLRQIGLTLISPGLLATVILFTPVVNENPPLAFAIGGGFTLVVIAVLTLVGARSWRARIGAVILALIVSLPTSLLYLIASRWSNGD